MKFRQLDLNLLRVLVALHRTGSVTLAGQALALSQPATSHALAKLRHALDDELFVRSAKGLKPTKLCQQLAPQLTAQLAQLESTFGPAQPFNPQTNAVHWQVSLSDLGEMMFLPALAKTLRDEAPLTQISNVAVDAAEVPRALIAREIDFSIGILQSRHHSVRSEKLFEENYVAVTAMGWRPKGSASRSKINGAQLREAKLVVASPTATFHSGIERILKSHQLTGQVILRTRHFGAIPELTVNTDLLAIVPTMYAERMAQRQPLRIWELPVQGPGYAVNLLWHASTDFDSAQLYVRDKVRQLFARP